MLGIDIHGDAAGDGVIRHCYFAEFYSPAVCRLVSNMDRGLWAPVVECFMAALANESFSGRRLDVRENVRFKGGYLVRWVHATIPQAAPSR
jgi:hypothetical protein